MAVLLSALLAADAISVASTSTRSSLFGPVYWQGPSHGRLVALTFDDGPDPRWTPSILKTLKQNHIPATFFLEGTNVQSHPALARAERDAGDEIGDHSWDHRDFLWLGPHAIRVELDRTQRAIRQATGLRPHLFRPPYGRRNVFMWPAARERGLQTVEWTLSPWRGRNPLASDLVHVALRDCRPGTIILLHDGRGNRRQTVEALPQMISGLKRLGYHFVTISQMEGRQRV